MTKGTQVRVGLRWGQVEKHIRTGSTDILMVQFRSGAPRPVAVTRVTAVQPSR